MSSLVVISNKALRKLGCKEILSLTQQGKEAERCNAAVRDIVKEVLRVHAWSHATVWASLARLSTDPPFGYDYAYQLPNECLRVVDIRQLESLDSPKIDWTQVAGKKIYTDASPCYVRYVAYNESAISTFPPDFIDACAWRLAAEIAGPLAKTGAIQPSASEYRYALDTAILNDTATTHERQQDVNQTNPLLSSRGYPSQDDEGGFW